MSQGTGYKLVYSHFSLGFWTNAATNILKNTKSVSYLIVTFRF